MFRIYDKKFKTYIEPEYENNEGFVVDIHGNIYEVIDKHIEFENKNSSIELKTSKGLFEKDIIKVTNKNYEGQEMYMVITMEDDLFKAKDNTSWIPLYVLESDDNFSYEYYGNYNKTSKEDLEKMNLDKVF